MALFDLCGKMLKEAPVSAKKLSLELESNKKVLLQFEFFAAGMTMGFPRPTGHFGQTGENLVF